MYLALRLIIVNHWVACGLYIITSANFLILDEQKSTQKLQWNYNYWIPQVDMAKGETDFWET